MIWQKNIRNSRMNFIFTPTMHQLIRFHCHEPIFFYEIIRVIYEKCGTKRWKAWNSLPNHLQNYDVHI